MVELVVKLKALGLLGEELLYTTNGKEYVTRERAAAEVKAAVRAAGGRIPLVRPLPRTAGWAPAPQGREVLRMPASLKVWTYREAFPLDRAAECTCVRGKSNSTRCLALVPHLPLHLNIGVCLAGVAACPGRWTCPPTWVSTWCTASAPPTPWSPRPMAPSPSRRQGRAVQQAAQHASRCSDGSGKVWRPLPGIQQGI